MGEGENTTKKIFAPAFWFLAAICLIALPAPAGVTVTRYYDANANGENDGEPPTPGWGVTIGDDDFYTPVFGVTLPLGTYTIREATLPGWRATTPGSAAIILGRDEETVAFGNLCLGQGGTVARFLDRQGGGEAGRNRRSRQARGREPSRFEGAECQPE